MSLTPERYGPGLPTGGKTRRERMMGDEDYSPEYQDEYQRLWHEAAAERDALRAEIAALRKEWAAENVGRTNAADALREAGEGLDVAAAKMLRLSFSMDQKAMAAAWFKWLEIINDLTEACARWREASSGAANRKAGGDASALDAEVGTAPAAPDDPQAGEGA